MLYSLYDTIHTHYYKENKQYLIAKTGEIKTIIESLNERKATDSDQIPISFYKKHSTTLSQIITPLINICFKLNQFPVQMKETKIKALLKNPDISSPDNYRPIAITNTIDKVVDRFLLKHLKNSITKFNLFPPNQHGFRENFSTHTALNTVFSFIQQSKQLKLSCSLLSLDLSKAFDSVLHTALALKLQEQNIPKHIIHHIYSYLHNRHIKYIQYNQEYSTSLAKGTPQGSSLSPILFTLFLNDLLITVNKATLSLLDTHIIAFADDLLIYTRAKHQATIAYNITTILSIITSWLDNWQLKLNYNKTQLITLSFSTPKLKSFSIHYRNHIFTPATSLKYLGVIIDSKLLFSDQINYIIDKLYKRLYNLKHLTQSHSKFHPNLIYNLINATYIKTITYSIQYWGHKTLLKTTSSKLNKILKIIITKHFSLHPSASFDSIFYILQFLPINWLYIKITLLSNYNTLRHSANLQFLPNKYRKIIYQHFLKWQKYIQTEYPLLHSSFINKEEILTYSQQHLIKKTIKSYIHTCHRNTWLLTNTSNKLFKLIRLNYFSPTKMTYCFSSKHIFNTLRILTTNPHITILKENICPYCSNYNDASHLFVNCPTIRLILSIHLSSELIHKNKIIEFLNEKPNLQNFYLTYSIIKKHFNNLALSF